MNRFSLFVVAIFSFVALFAQQVSRERMNEIYEEVRTPYKYGMVVVPEDNKHKIDCPTVFRENDKWYMTYVVYNGRTGTDGRGYETWIAESENLLEWKTLGRVLSYRNGFWDENQRGGFPALTDMEWGGSYELQTFKGRHWMTYIGGKGKGYEAIEEPLHIGLAWTEKPISVAHEWEALDKPLLSINDKDAQWWEKLTQYKSTIYWDKSKRLGYPFVMFYNAGGIHPESGLKAERVGIALSKNLKKWKRYADNPVFAHEASGTITGDAHIQRMGDLYVMFYFSAFEPTRKYKAYNTFAASYDLINWTDWDGEDLIIPSKDYDELFAHKSYVVKHDGVVYHFYCAVNNDDQRGIAVATSKPMGRSEVDFPARSGGKRRVLTELSEGWKTWLVEANQGKHYFADLFNDRKVIEVTIPHNWDDYFGYRQFTHGNLHGTAMYVKDFNVDKKESRRYFIRFEGIGTYASIKLNNSDLGRYPVGRTTLTLDVTDKLFNGKNILSVKVEHPEMITDMPWVCGGCSSEWGFSEGSQPLGIFRPIVLEETDEVRIEPFGVHVWHDDKAENVFIDTELKNYSSQVEKFELVNKFADADGKQVFRLVDYVTLQPGEIKTVRQQSAVKNPNLWSDKDPYLYKLTSMIKRNGKTTDEIITPFGIRTISWPVKRNDGDGRFFLNGKPVFLNGVCEYEHQFGQSHAFSHEQVTARVKQMLAAGFNAFRDAHQPHHLDYQKYWDQEGILFWTQFSAHIWYDTPEFRENFKKLLRQWVKERRNSPSVVIWGLQNESTLPREFAEECCEIIREMDPTADNMRIITTCNGGEGTDWNVIQNWSGTYGGDIEKYHTELASPEQLLNGEYGAWRSIDLHTEPASFDAKGIWSEERMCTLMETKVRRAEQVRDSVCGHFQWIYSSHDNPGRRQPDEAYRMIDKVGPFNYKGLVTPWEEPTDVYYMYKANYISPEKEPMVYIAAHGWKDRFLKSGRRRATIEVFSNCDSVLLYNDATDHELLGCKKQLGIGTHFTWENRDVKYNVLRAVGYYEGKSVCEDIVIFDGLERSPHFESLYMSSQIVPTAADNNREILKPAVDYKYIYRMNCGGDSYTDSYGNQWMSDNTQWSSSWADRFVSDSLKGFSPYQASQRMTNDPIHGTRDWELFQYFRFGRHQLKYTFPVPNGDYRVELYFIEPWHGTGGSEQTDCEGLRLFDVAINGKTVIDDLDVWASSGHDGVCKKVVDVQVTEGNLVISFPEVKCGQAIISAIAIASLNYDVLPVPTKQADFNWKSQDTIVMVKMAESLLPEDKNGRKTTTYEAEKAKIQGKYTRREHRKQMGIFFGKGEKNNITWTVQTGLAQIYALRFKFMNSSEFSLPVNMRFVDAKGVVLREEILNFPPTPEKWRILNTTTGTYVNAGTYKVELSAPVMDGLSFDAVDIQ